MDLGQIQVENGCFVEEEGSTYCFCDFNRCNAAGILDLRNLIEMGRSQPQLSKNFNSSTNLLLSPSSDTRTKLLNNVEIEKDGFIELNRYSNDIDEEIATTTIPIKTTANTTTTPKTTTTTKPPPQTTRKSQQTSSTPLTIVPTSAYLSTLPQQSSHAAALSTSESEFTFELPSNIINQTTNTSTAFPFKTSYDPLLNNLDQLLVDYLNFSKTVNSHLITESIRQQILKSLKGNDRLLKKFEQYTNEFKKNMNKQSSEQDESIRQRTTTHGYTTTRSAPMLYKLNINDSYSKNLLDNVSLRTKFGLKSNDKLNILIKKPSMEEQPKLGQLVVESNSNKHSSGGGGSNGVTPFSFNKLNPIILQKVKQDYSQTTTTRCEKINYYFLIYKIIQKI